MSESNHELIRWLRESSPYINKHRHNTAVIAISSRSMQHRNSRALLHDIATLRTLGVKIVIVFGTRAYIDEELAKEGRQPQLHDQTRVTTKECMDVAIKVAGLLRHQIESQLSMGLVNSPMHEANISVSSGNFIVAQPIGIRNGIDFAHSGTVRKVRSDAIKRHLDLNDIVLIGPIGHSPSGESFNLQAEELAAVVAEELDAQKLIFNLSDLPSDLPNQIESASFEQTLHQYSKDSDIYRSVAACAKSVENGVERGHIIDINEDGALLTELYTRDGSGTMVVQRNYLDQRPATEDDLPGIISLIKPLEESGNLVKRSRKQLELDLPNFYVIAKDGLIIACCMLIPFAGGQQLELACVATHAQYRGQGIAKHLMSYALQEAKKRAATSLFILTTRSEHWFIEQGFNQVSIDKLPEQRQASYDHSRNSKAMLIQL